jgi:hypothetical protein
MGTAEGAGTDEYLARLVTFLGSQELTRGVDPAAVVSGARRDDLGISSLNIIMLVMAYLKKNGAPGLKFSPKWVPRLEDVDGIVSVLREIDDSRLAAAAS